MLDCQATFATSLLPPSEAPIPISATFDVSSEILIVRFDQPILPGILDPGNWSVRAANERFPSTTSIATDSIVTTIAGTAVPEIGPNQCFYTPPPSDVIGQNALPALAFANFPVTLI